MNGKQIFTLKVLTISNFILFAFGITISYYWFQFGSTDGGWILLIFLLPIFIVMGVLLITLSYFVFRLYKDKTKIYIYINYVLIFIYVLLILINVYSPTLRPVIKTDAWIENTLFDIRESISNYANGDGKKLPESLWERGYSQDIEKTIIYIPNTKPKDKSEQSVYGIGEYIFYYQLCANFKKDTGAPKEPRNISGVNYDYVGYKISDDGYQRYHEFNKHRKGYYCFKIKTG